MEVKATWLGFKLNHLQSILILILAFIGLLNIPFGLLVGVNGLLDAIFLSIPAHLANPVVYTIYYLFDAFKNPIITIAVYLSFFLLCIYTIRKIIRNDQNSIFKETSSQEQISSWFGFKLNHSQSILLFLFSVIGIISISASFLHGENAYPSGILFFELLPSWNRNLQRMFFALIHLTIFVIILYTLIKMKMNYTKSRVERTHPTFVVITFIILLVITIFSVFKLLTLTYSTMDWNDLILFFVLLLAGSNVISFLFLRKPHISFRGDSSSESSFSGTKGNGRSSKRKLIALTISIFVFIIIFSSQFMETVCRPISYIDSYFFSLLYRVFILFLISIPFLIIFYCFLNSDNIGRTLDNLDLDLDRKWLGQKVKIKSQAIILFWTSLAQISYLLIYLYNLYPDIVNPFASSYEYFKTLLLVILTVIISIFCLYNIIRLYSMQKLNGKTESHKTS